MDARTSSTTDWTTIEARRLYFQLAPPVPRRGRHVVGTVGALAFALAIILGGGSRASLVPYVETSSIAVEAPASTLWSSSGPTEAAAGSH